MEIEAIIGKVDTPSWNGITYPRSVMENAIKNSGIDKRRLMITFGNSDIMTTEFDRIIGYATKIDIVDCDIKMCAKLLDTQMGTLVTDMMGACISIGYSVSSVATVVDGVAQDDCRLLRIDAGPKLKGE